MGIFSRIRSGYPYSVIVLVFFLFIYLIFPSGLSTTDGWQYAADIKHSGELFYPYHLLYNYLGYIICYLPVGAGADTLSCLKIMNAFFAVFSLLAVQMIMRKLDKSELISCVVSSLSGISYSVIRYATENETYIVPLSLGLFAYYFYLSFLKTGFSRFVIYSGLLASLSVLFHATYIFWWIGILTGLFLEKNGKILVRYLLVSLAVPLVYAFVILYLYGIIDRESVTDFLISDFPGDAFFKLTYLDIFFSIVNLLRSYVQIHGYMINLINKNILLLAPAIVSFFFFILALFSLPYRLHLSKKGKDVFVLLLLFILMFSFSVLSDGNAEFMVMLPALSFIVIPLLFEGCERFMIMLLTGMMIWNISYGLLPLSVNSGEAEYYLCNKALHEENTLIISSDEHLLKSMIYYGTGERIISKIMKSPALMEMSRIDPEVLTYTIDSCLQKGASIYTNSAGNRTISRAAIIEGSRNDTFFRRYDLLSIQTFNNIFDTRTIYEITGRRDTI